MNETSYAGFWNRFAAFVIDQVVTVVGGAIILFPYLVYVVVVVLTSDDPPALDEIESLANGIGLVAGWVYYALMESSRFQGTLGKMAVQIKVTDLDGNRISFGRATGRHFGKILSGILLLAGFIMVAFTEKKQGLHDIMAGCLVVRK